MKIYSYILLVTLTAPCYAISQPRPEVQKPGFWTKTKKLFAALGFTAIGTAATIYFVTKSKKQSELDNKLVRAAIDHHGDDNFLDVALLLDEGASPNAENPSGIGILQSVLEHGKNETFTWLISHKPYLDVNSPDTRGMTPLQATAYSRVHERTSLAMMESLFTHGAEQSIDKTTQKYPDTPLMIAAEKGDAEVVKLLLQHNANPNAHDTQGTTILMKAVKDNNTAKDVPKLSLIINELTNKGARVKVTNKKNESPLSLAKEPAIIKLLQQKWLKQN